MTGSHAFRWFGLATGLGMLLCPSPAPAQEDPAALVEEGIRLREQRLDAEALAQFERAYAIEAQTRTLVQIALAEQALSRFVEAEAHLEIALEDRQDPFIRRHRRLLREAMADLATHLGSLRVEAGLPGATLTIGDREVGVLPLTESFRVAVGTVRLTVSAAGFIPSEQTVEIYPGEETSVELTDLLPVEVEVQAPAPATAPEDPSPSAGPPPSAQSNQGLGSGLVIGGVAAAAAGIVSAAVGGVFFAIREDHAQARQQCSDTDPACRDRYYAALEAEAIGIGATVGGTVLAAGGATLAILASLGLFDDGQAEGDESPSASCSPLPMGLRCAGRF